MKSPRIIKALFCSIILTLLLLTTVTPVMAISIVEYNIPTAVSNPYRITTGPDGNLWFAEATTDKIGKITTAGIITEYIVPTSGSSPWGITSGTDGNLWFTEYIGNNIGRLTTTGVFTEFPIPTAGSQPSGITSGPDGNLWFVEGNGNKIGKITTTGAITEYAIPTAGSQPFNITVGPDNNLWFTEYNSNQIGKITTSGVFTEYAIPTAGSGPVDIVAGNDGNLWFTEYSGNKIGKITTAGVITEYTVPTAGGTPYGITAGSDGNLWFTEYIGNKVGSITTSGTFTEFIVPTSGSFPYYITNGPDGNLWFGEYTGNKIGKLILDSNPPTVIATSLTAAMSQGTNNFTVTFNEKVNDPPGNTNIDDVTNPNNYMLVEDGVNGVFNTVSCLGDLIADDTKISVNSITYIPNTAIVSLSNSLPDGNYRLYVCGTTSIRDLSLNPLNGGVDFSFDFIVGTAAPTRTGKTTASSLPKTGFIPNKITALPVQPATLEYAELGDLWLEIPSLNVKSNIVGVPQNADKTWDVTWLGNDTGWLNGTAFPTWNGNSVLTAHVVNASGLDGPFAALKSLKYGDQIIVHLGGGQYVYEVRNSRLARPYSTSYAFESKQDASYLTLITCQGYNPLNETYLFRRVVRLVLVEVKGD